MPEPKVEEKPPDPVPTPAPAENPQLAQLLEALNRMNTTMTGMSANIEILMKAQAQQRQASPAKAAPKGDTAAEREARRKQAQQEREERIQKAKGYKSLSIDAEPPKDTPGQIKRLKTPYSLAPGTKINFATEAKVSNEADGPFLACVTERVLDSATHSIEVIPQMACFMMRISRQAIYGDTRLTVEASTLTFPNGNYVKLDGVSVGDRTGTPGFADQIDRHLWRNIGAVVMRSALQLGSAVSAGMGGGLAQQAGTIVTGQVASHGVQQTQQYLRTEPTMTIRHGYLGTLYLEEELVLSEAYEG
jgi:type IV secretory pathway VirB10-like protein